MLRFKAQTTLYTTDRSGSFSFLGGRSLDILVSYSCIIFWRGSSQLHNLIFTAPGGLRYFRIFHFIDNFTLSFQYILRGVQNRSSPQYSSLKRAGVIATGVPASYASTRSPSPQSDELCLGR